MRVPVLAASLAVVLAACGEEDERPPAACDVSVREVRAALRSAPDRVSLGGSELISTCVHRSTGQADSQATGIVLSHAAEELAESLARSDDAALQLGYLVGATRRGERGTSGRLAELVTRLESVAGLGGPPPSRREAYDRGLAAGERTG